MKMSERKKNILRIVVNEYIQTAMPVSSKAISDNHLKGVSSATVRNELATLEELGFLTQFHTSGGRIPSPMAYRFYIEELMQKNEFSEEELNKIRSAFSLKTGNVECLIKDVTQVISELTDYTSVAIAPHGDGEIVQSIALFPCGNLQALLLLMTSERLLKDSYVKIPEGMGKNEIDGASRMLNRLFAGKKLSEIEKASVDAIEELAEYRSLMDEVVDALCSYTRTRESDVVLAGENKIFKHPEYGDITRVKDFLSVVQSKEKIAGLMDGGSQEIRLSVRIGSEEQDGGVPKDCSLVTASYSVGGKSLGTYGVLGPIRMDYRKVISVLESIGKILENISENKE